MRMLHELKYHQDSSFITLTYDDEHLPPNASLVKADLQKYFKRLRKSIEPKKIRYFACGEYGDQTFRPHYHAILFGLGIKDKNLIELNWPNGFTTVGLAEPDSIQYVAGYIDKKYSGDQAEEEYILKNREPVFRLSSLGLGRNYCDDQSQQIIDNQYITVKGIKHSIPRYYLKRLGIDTDSIKDKAIERNSEICEKYSGIYIDSDALYKHGTPEENRRYIEGVKSAKMQHDKNLNAKIKLKVKKL